MAWKKKYGVTRRLKAKQDEEYRKRRNEQGCSDPEKRKEYLREYYKQNPERFTKTPEQQKAVHAARRKAYAESPEIRAAACAAAKAWREANPDKAKSVRLKKYGITLDQYNAMLKKQGGKCAICGHSATDKPLFFPVVDHCHERNVFRGLLCMNCNQGLGKFKDNIELLQAAIRYLKRSRK